MSRRSDISEVEHHIAPINRLPNELLVQIFLHYAEDATPPSTPHRPRSANMRWLPLMVVCRYWRRVAVASPGLWRVIDAAFKTSWTKLLLARSVPATIDFTFGVRGFSPVKTFKALSPHVKRLRTLLFSRVENTWRPAALAFLRNAGDLPNLETLKFPISVSLSNTEETGNKFDHVQLSAQRFPCLRSLVLRRTIAPQDPLLCAKLQSLSLAHCLCGSSFDHFLDTLTSCTLLQDFTLVACLQHLSGDWATSSTPRRAAIHLPNLKRLWLSEHMPIHTSQFLSHLFLPQTVSAVITSNVPPVHSNTVYSIQADVLPRLHSATMPVLAAATDVTITATWVYSLDSRPSIASPGVLLSLQIPVLLGSSWSAVMTLSRAVHDLIGAFGSAPLKRLTIEGDCNDAARDTWSNMFRAFPVLESLQARPRKGSWGDTLNLLLGLRDASQSGTSSACPDLKAIEVYVFDTSHDEFWEALIECLRCRSERNFALPKVGINVLCALDDFSEVTRILDPRLRGLVTEYALRRD